MRSALLPAVAALALGGPMPRVIRPGETPCAPSTLYGWSKASTNRYAGTPPGAREAARIAWRAEDRASHAEWLDVYSHPEYVVVRLAGADPDADTVYAWSEAWMKRSDAATKRRDACLSPESKPWRSTRKPTPRRRYSRAHRRGCARCQLAVTYKDGAWVEVMGAGSLKSADRLFPTQRWIDGQDPHGRRA